MDITQQYIASREKQAEQDAREALAQSVADLHVKFDALTELVSKLLKSKSKE